MRNLKYILLTTIIIISSTTIFSAEDETFSINSLKLHIRITELTDSEEPFIHADKLVFTYKPSKKNARHVGIAFEEEKFSKIHNLHRNENGIFFYMYKYPKREKVNYRFIEDGVWISDKKNRNVKMDNNFITLSSFVIPQKNIKEHTSPIVKNNQAKFRLKAEENSSVYLTGDFNNWNPFLYPLEEVEPGIYELTINLPKGKYGYYYIYNGKKTLDWENFSRGTSRLGEEVSIFSIQ